MIASLEQTASIFSAPPAHERVAIKVQRRMYARDALNEMDINRRVDRNHASSRYIVRLLDALYHDGHVCQVHELVGSDARKQVKVQPLPVADVKELTRQLLLAVEHFHSLGFAHTDIKPRNILWCGQRRETRLIDLGNADDDILLGDAIATCDYCPPEMLIGIPMGKPVDMWCVGCTVFELLTGEKLFDPWSVCRTKYHEFNSDDNEEETINEDDLAEEREQLAPGTILAGKYRLLHELGRGKVATVWEAEKLHDEPLAPSLPSVEEARGVARAATIPKPERKGYDIYKVVVNYEHFVLMQERLGVFPDQLARQGMYRHILYNDEGALRFHPEIRPDPLHAKLQGRFSPDEISQIVRFLTPLLALDPAARPTAAEALRSGWLQL